jgi:protein-S-isoprenylcysteine O-methyltransferase Ste14
MSAKIREGWIPAACIFYVLIVFEIIFMISPFALYYYSGYGSVLNLLHHSKVTAWMSGFFLPHYTESTSWILNSLKGIGYFLFLLGLVMFLMGAGQIYYAKFKRKNAVTKGLYKSIRHPQYSAFAITGLGVLLVWPRFFVLIGYVTMLFVYYYLAKKEERDCLAKYGEHYRIYLESTSMFLPKRFSVYEKLPEFWHEFQQRRSTPIFNYVVVLFVFLITAFWIRNYSIRSISTLYSNDSATISTALMDEAKMEKILQLALKEQEVQNKLKNAGYNNGSKFLNYIVPNEWILADLPLENIPNPEEIDGHYQPENYNQKEYKVLFTKAKLHDSGSITGPDILKRTYKREPVLVVRLNISTKKIMAIETPPQHVVWGNIPTPLF